MTPAAVLRTLPRKTRQSFEKRLAELYAEMDAAYEAAAVQYGFCCTGCADNCCLTRFHHHTLVELAQLALGLSRLRSTDRKAAVRRAGDVRAAYDAAEKDRRPPRVMCPLNVAERCLVYPSRPMICRMHGIPHVLRAPGRPPAYGPGCAAFARHCGEVGGNAFDRTPLYRKMAALEQRINMTVADMVLQLAGEAP